VSGPSPFAACPAGALLPSSHAYPDAEVEPALAINPVDPANVIGAYQQDRWSDGAARGIVVASSRDGGRTWQRQALPFSRCAGGDRAAIRVGDPWVAFGPKGTAWVIATGSDGVHVAVSSDKGTRWRASRIYRDAGGRSADKPSIAADPDHPSRAYATWYTIDRSTRTLSSWLSRTADGGVTWSDPQRMATSEVVPVAGASRKLGPVSPMIIATRRPPGLYVLSLYEPFSPTPHPPFGLGFQRSTDQGRTWSAPRIIQDVLPVEQTTDQNNDRPVRTGTEVVNAAADPRRGDLYAVWQDARFSGGRHDAVALSRSADGGGHWSAPVAIDSVHGSPAVVPAIAVDAAGRVGVSFLDWRDLEAGDNTTLPARYRLAVSVDQARHFQTQALSSAFDLMLAPDAGGLFLGDYTGLAACRGGFCAMYATTNRDEPSNPTDIRFWAE
jgi:hypothetical protein